MGFGGFLKKAFTAPAKGIHKAVTGTAKLTGKAVKGTASLAGPKSIKRSLGGSRR